MVMASGRKLFEGATPRGIEIYNGLFDVGKPVVAGSGRATIHNLRFLDLHGNTVEEIAYQEHLTIEITFNVDPDIRYPTFFVGFYDQEMRCVAEINSRNNGVILNNTGERMQARVAIDQTILNPGDYKVSCCIYCERMQEHCAWHFAAWKIRVNGDFVGMNPIQLPGKWNISNEHL
jgi:hypothetical protein